MECLLLLLTVEKIKLSVEQALKTLQVPKEYPFKDKLILQLLENVTVKSSSSAIIKSENDHIDWYDNTKDRPYWESYREYLKNDKIFGYTDNYIKVAVEASHSIINTIQNVRLRSLNGNYIVGELVN